MLRRAVACLRGGSNCPPPARDLPGVGRVVECSAVRRSRRADRASGLAEQEDLDRGEGADHDDDDDPEREATHQTCAPSLIRVRPSGADWPGRFVPTSMTLTSIGSELWVAA